MSEALSSSTHKSRKPRPCFLCGKQIETGAVYVRNTGVTDRNFWSIAMHVRCEMKTWDWDATDWETFSRGDLQQLASEQGEVKR
jgi:hypothetical protein